MIPYISLLFFLIFICFFEKTNYRNFLFATAGFLFIFLCVFRYGGTGLADYQNYLEFYTQIKHLEDVLDENFPAEIGFRFFSYIGNLLGLHEHSIIFLMGLLSTYIIIKIIKEYSINKAYSLIIWMPYFLTMNMHSARTSVASAFGILFILNFFKRKLFYSILFFFMAFAFHKASIILLLVFLSKIRIRNLVFILIATTLFTLLSDVPNFLNSIMQIFPNTLFQSKLNAYQESDLFGYSMSLYDPRIIWNFFVFFSSLIVLKKFKDELTIYLFKLHIIGTTILVGMSFLMILSWRCSYFYFITTIIYLPILIKEFEKILKNKIHIGFISRFIFLSFYFFYSAYLIIKAEPYESILLY